MSSAATRSSAIRISRQGSITGPAGRRWWAWRLRMLGHITYLSREGMMEKFDAQRFKPRLVRSEFETKFSVGSYLAHQGDRFGERFDANSYLALSMAMDLFDLGYTRERLAAAIRAARCRWLLMSFTSDWLFLPFQSQEIVDALVAAGQPVSYCNIQSRCGHDAFLLPDDLPVYGELIRAFLANLDGRPIYTLPAANPADAETAALSPTSIFHSRHRLDYDKIVELIPPGASVLDLGCGTGRLLARLAVRGHKRLVGIEWNEQSVVHGLRRGLDVVQADLNQGLAAFQDGQFDIVVLSQTLQTVTDVERLIGEMLRIGAADRQLPQHGLPRPPPPAEARPGAANRRRGRPPLVQHAERAIPLARRLRGVLRRKGNRHPPNRRSRHARRLPGGWRAESERQRRDRRDE